jgi:hypothetical protein
MHFRIAILFLFLTASTQMQAIGEYQPGDTLYVWSFSGLLLRNRPALNAARLKTIPYGTALVSLSYNGSKNIDVDIISAFSQNNKQLPAVVIKGDFARVVFEGDTGYVYDGYLSKLPALRQIKTNPAKQPVFESFEVYAARNFGLLRDIKKGKVEYGKQYVEKQVFGNGIVIDTKMEKGGETRIILPDVSLEESLMLFKYLTGCTWDVPVKAKKGTEVNWNMSKISDTEWTFANDHCAYQIRYFPSTAISVYSFGCQD